jgi:hypothetical protein
MIRFSTTRPLAIRAVLFASAPRRRVLSIVPQRGFAAVMAADITAQVPLEHQIPSAEAAGDGPSQDEVKQQEETVPRSLKKPKLHGRAFYESIGSPKFVLAPMVDQSEFVRYSTFSALPLLPLPPFLPLVPCYTP